MEINCKQCDFSGKKEIRYPKALKIKNLANLVKLLTIHLAISQEIVHLIKKEYINKIM